MSCASTVAFGLPLSRWICYNTVTQRKRRTEPRQEQVMQKLYFDFWIPFTINKRRILILAIASYVAMC